MGEREPKPLASGYECRGCGARFFRGDYDEGYLALEAASKHVREEHNTTNDLKGFRWY